MLCIMILYISMNDQLVPFKKKKKCPVLLKKQTNLLLQKKKKKLKLLFSHGRPREYMYACEA